MEMRDATNVKPIAASSHLLQDFMRYDCGQHRGTAPDAIGCATTDQATNQNKSKDTL